MNVLKRARGGEGRKQEQKQRFFISFISLVTVVLREGWVWERDGKERAEGEVPVLLSTTKHVVRRICVIEIQRQFDRLSRTSCG